MRAFVVLAELDRPGVRAITTVPALRATSVEALSVVTSAGPRPCAQRGRRSTCRSSSAPHHRTTSGRPWSSTSPPRAAPHGLAVVYLPEVTARRGWRRLLLGREQARLRERLLALPGTVVTSVPWPIEES